MAVSIVNISPVIIGSNVSLVNADLIHDKATCVTNVFLFSCNPLATFNNEFLNKSGNSDLQKKSSNFYKSCIKNLQTTQNQMFILKNGKQFTYTMYFNVVFQKEN